MSSRKSLNTASSVAARDALLGRALSKKMNAGAVSHCLSPEETAGLLEGTVTTEKRDLLLRHLAGCERCYEAFRIARELAERVEAPPGKRWFTAAPVAAVVVLALVFLTIMSSPPGRRGDEVGVAVKEQTEPAVAAQAGFPSLVGKARQTEGVPAQKSDLPTAAATARVLTSRGIERQFIDSIAAVPGLGAGGALTAEKIAFRLGVHAVDLELLLRVGDRDGATRQLKQMLKLARQAGYGASELDALLEVEAELRAGTAPGTLTGAADVLQAAGGRETEMFYSLGVWAEGGRLAVISGNAGLVDSGLLPSLHSAAEDGQTPHGVFNALKEIDAAINSSGAVTARLKRAFDDLFKFF